MYRYYILLFINYCYAAANDNLILNERINSLVHKNVLLGFEENKGQIVDNDGNAAPYVLFKTEALGINIWVTTSGLTYQFLKFENTGKEESKLNFDNDKNDSTLLRWHRVDMILKNANIRKENIITEGDITQGKVDYYLGHCPNGIFNVKTFSKITIKNIYEGIDWVLYANNSVSKNSLKQDFIVHPNADPDQIKLIYEGSGKFDIKDNQIHFENEIGELQEGKLFCYQKNQQNEIKSEYFYKKVKRQMSDERRESPEFIIPTSNIQHPSSDIFSYEVSIQLGNYTKNQPLIIDPELVWGTFYGGTSFENINFITTDTLNNLFLTGSTFSANFPLMNAGSFYQGTLNVTGDAFILKFDSTCTRKWATYYGGSNSSDNATSLVTDNKGNIFITGHTWAPNFPLQNAGTYFQATNNNSTDLFILKFDNNGNRLWATYYGGNHTDESYSIACDTKGNIFITGRTTSISFPVQNAGTYFQGILTGGAGTGSLYLATWDIFIIKFDNNGNRLWATYYGGVGPDEAYSICTDIYDNVFITGNTLAKFTTNVNNFPLLNSSTYFQGTYNPYRNDAFILKFDNNGNRLWATYYGGNDWDYGNSLATDSKGNLYITGRTSSTDLPIKSLGSAYFKGALSGPSDIYLTKFDNLGNLIWGTYYGGTKHENHRAFDNICINNCDDVYISGETESTDFPIQTCGYIDNTYGGSIGDMFIAKFSSSGNVNWSSYIGGNGWDQNNPIAVDKDDNLYLSGLIRNQNQIQIINSGYPIANTGGSAYYDGSFNTGDGDIFIAKFQSLIQITNSYSTPAICTCIGTASINVKGGCGNYIYQWYDSSWVTIGSNSNSIQNLCAGTYHVIVKDSFSCSKPDTATFNINFLSHALVNQAASICDGSNYTLPGGTVVSTSGTYTDTIPSTNGCDTIITTNLTVNLNTTSTQNGAFCSGSSFTLPNGTIVTTPGTYTSVIPNAKGCDSTITSIVIENQNTSSIQNDFICFGSTFTLPDGIIVNSAGTYTSVIPNSKGCDSTITLTLTVASLPTVFISNDTTIGAGESKPLFSSGGITYNWTPSNGLNCSNCQNPVATPFETTTYCVTVTDTNGCKKNACVRINVEDCPSNVFFIVPNAFSPNADGVNDEFCLSGWEDCILSFEIDIYNRWGEKVFTSTQPNFCWDGKYKGSIMNPAVYVYEITATIKHKQKEIIRKGNISLIK